MAKKGMKRPEHTHTKPHNEVPPVTQIAGKAKSGKVNANNIIAGTHSPSQKVYHTAPFSVERPISQVFSELDIDLARDNVEIDMTAADLQDL